MDAALEAIISKASQQSGKGFQTPLDDKEYARKKAEAFNATEGTLENYDCKKCNNKGFIMKWRDDGSVYSEVCDCVEKRRSRRLIELSGLSNLMERYNFGTWKENEPWQKNLREKAERYAAEPNGWFYIAGRPGTGKTHICTAICSALLERGYAVRYLVWRDFSVKAKALANDSDRYAEVLAPYRYAQVLYVDDLFKTRQLGAITDGDFNVAFELLNDRYNNDDLLTIISSEIPAEKLMEIDEGLGSRIFERSRANCVNLAGKDNWRTKR